MDAAIRELEKGDWEAGLSALNALWCKTHCVALAAQIERLSAHAATSRPPLAGEGKELQTAWEGACAEGRLVGLERLLGVLRDGTAKDLRTRFERLVERAPDPRMTQAVTLFANELHLRSDSSRAVWTAFFKLVVRTGDPRARPPLERLAQLARAVIDASATPQWEKFEQYLVKQIPKALAKLPKAGTYGGLAALTEQVDALLARPFVSTSKAPGGVEQLHAAVLDEPGDDVIRVWTDALLEAGDERGTFALLQMTAEERPLTAAEAKNEAQLLKAHRLAWLGGAGAVIEAKTATFRRGLLDSALLAKKAQASHLSASEFRSVAQLWSRTPALLGHENLVSLRRLGRCAVPNPHSTRGLVGFDYPAFHNFSWEETLELAGLGLQRITHLETGLPRNCDISALAEAFPALETVLVTYSWSTQTLKVFEPLFGWLSTMRDVILVNMMDSRKADDAHFVDRLPRSNVHIVYGGGELHRSYMRRDGKLHAVFTDTSGKGGFSDGRSPGPDLERWRAARMGFFSRLPAVDSLSFRQRSTWPAHDVEAVAARTAKLKNVTLPKAKRG